VVVHHETTVQQISSWCGMVRKDLMMNHFDYESVEIFVIPKSKRR